MMMVEVFRTWKSRVEMAKKRNDSRQLANPAPSKPRSKKSAAAPFVSGLEEADGLPDFVIQHLQQLALPEENKLTLPPLPEHFRVLGRPPLLPRPGEHSTMVPDGLKSHPLIKGKCFYTLPAGLLQSIERHAKQVTQKNDAWPLEKELAAICDDHSQQVGFRDGQPLLFSLLRPPRPLGLTPELARNLGWGEFNTAQVAQLNRTLDGRLIWMNTIARGYVGWLNSNAFFRRERDEIFAASPRVVSLTPDTNAEASGESLPQKVQDFLIRWRLLGMAGPRLPISMRPMLSGEFPTSILRQLMAAGGLFNLPDIYPIPSRDLLRAMLEEAVRTAKPEHLREWMKITQSNNLTKTSIARLSRELEVQHYWELLFERHEAGVAGQITRLHDALADFLSTTADNIKKDLQFLRRQLGKAWPKQP
jgi:hypothetical protein